MAQRGAADNTNSAVAPANPDADMSAWAGDYATTNNGRISRDAYLNEIGRRWDRYDQGNQGLTPGEVGRITGKVDVDSSVPPRTSSDVQPGNMGPGSVKAE